MRDVFARIRITTFVHELHCTAVEDNEACECARTLDKNDVIHVLDSFPIESKVGLRCFIAVTQKGMVTFYLPIAEYESFFDSTFELPPLNRAA